MAATEAPGVSGNDMQAWGAARDVGNERFIVCGRAVLQVLQARLDSG